MPTTPARLINFELKTWKHIKNDNCQHGVGRPMPKWAKWEMDITMSLEQSVEMYENTNIGGYTIINVWLWPLVAGYVYVAWLQVQRIKQSLFGKLSAELCVQ